MENTLHEQARNPSRILAEARSGRIALTVKLNLRDPRVIELAGLTGLSAVWLCNEHVAGDWADLENCIRSARLRGIDAIVRVSKGAYSDYIKPFESGAAAIMVPHVSTAEEAREVVQMCRFAPLGRRALDGGNIDGNFCQTPLDVYLREGSHGKAIILQIESPEGLQNVEEIAAVEGYDFLLFGPGDYSNLIGKPGLINDPKVLEARAAVERAARNGGKWCMGVGVTGPADELLSRGYRLLNVGSDVVALGSSFRAMVEGFGEGVQKKENYYGERK